MSDEIIFVTKIHLWEVLKPKGGKLRRFFSWLGFGIAAGVIVGLIWVSLDYFMTSSAYRPPLNWIPSVYAVAAWEFGIGGAILGPIVGAVLGILQSKAMQDVRLRWWSRLMRGLRVFELISALVTLLLFIGELFFVVPWQSDNVTITIHVIGWFLLCFLPGLLLVVGAYMHTINDRFWGSIVVWIVAAFSLLMIGLMFFGGAIAYLGWWNVLPGLLPHIAAGITGIAAVLVVSETRKSHDALAGINAT